MRTSSILAALVALAGAALIPSSAEAKPPTWIGDATSGWVHIGGGAGLGDNQPDIPAGRVMLGLGAYTVGFYAGGELATTFTPTHPFSATGAAMVGIHIPTPVVHPMFGLRIGSGIAVGADGRPGPLVLGGGQVGAIIRQFDGQFGVRLMIDADVVVIRDMEPGAGGWAKGQDKVGPQVIGSAAFVF